MSQTTKPSLKVWLATILTSVPLFLFGFIGLGYENLASRVFFSYYTESSQSLSLVLAIFLVGLAVGSMLYARFSSFVSRSVVFIGLQILAATYMYVALSKFGWLVGSFQNHGFESEVLNQVPVGCITLLLPTVILGMVFPYLLSRNVRDATEPHSSIGRSNAIDLTGSVIGGLVAGFVFIPLLGTARSIFVMFVIHLFALVPFIVRRLRRLQYAVFALLFAGFCSGLANNNDFVNQAGAIFRIDPNGTNRKVLYYAESPFQSVMVDERQLDGESIRRLILGKRHQCDTKSFDKQDISEIHFVERALQQLPGGVRAVNIGLGCGLTAGLLSSSKSVDSLDIVEINPKVPPAAALFVNYNHDVLNDPKTNLIIKDGYTHLQDTNKNYGLIAIDVEEPSVLHSSRLYTVENFSHAASRLDNNGVLALWAFNNFNTGFTQTVYNSLAEAFTHIYVIQSGIYNDMYFLASQRPLDTNLLGQSDEDKVLQQKLETSTNTDTQTLDHNTLAKFWGITEKDIER